MELLPRAFDLNHRRDNRCSSGAAPCRLLVAFALAMLASIASPASASARCGAPLSFTYDAPSVARVDVQPFTPAEPRPTQLSGSRDESASPSVEARGTPTTPLTPVVATKSGALAKAGCSFTPETLVLMADGTTKPISQVEVGDMVMAVDPETGERGPREVTKLWEHEDDELVLVSVGGKKLKVTPNHPLWVVNRAEWVAASDLRTSDLLLDDDGKAVRISTVQRIVRPGVDVHNLTVDDIHTYFVVVGGHSLLVHNTGPLCDISGYAEHLTQRDLDAAMRELRGEVVARKPNGVPWDHVDEVTNAQRGLVQRIESIKSRIGYLKWKSPGSPGIAQLESTLGQASRLLDYSERYVPR